MVLFGVFPGFLVFVVDEVEALAQIVVVSRLFALIVVRVDGGAAGRAIAGRANAGRARRTKEGARSLNSKKKDEGDSKS